ncbi:MAG TPA: Ppx/GppA phosphatase family protein [Mycobacteriales bacterium]|nr:Ppx/GppA phosphatase family protein [Mycobacteriales bacterium]
MRLGVLDVGSNTVHLLVVDAHPGAPPLPFASHKAELRLAELLDGDGALSGHGAERLVATVGHARDEAEAAHTEDLVAFATSAVRDASNSTEVIARVRDETGVDLEVLPGEAEARLTFLAVRRWCGWSSGRLWVLDIGGGSLEVAAGTEEEPAFAMSLPLGAGRLTRDWFDRDVPRKSQVAALREHLRSEVASVAPGLHGAGEPDRVVATSKTFRSLARITGAAGYSRGPFVRRPLRRDALADWVPRLAQMSTEQRATLPGVSPSRAGQLVAGALVAEVAMDVLGIEELDVCPWALREGVILRRLDWLAEQYA